MGLTITLDTGIDRHKKSQRTSIQNLENNGNKEETTLQYKALKIIKGGERREILWHNLISLKIAEYKIIVREYTLKITL